MLQAPAGSTFQTVLAWTTGIGFSIVILGLATGLIPPPKHALADSSRIVSIYFDGQKKVITTDAPTVGDALKEAGVSLGTGDVSEPDPSAAIPQGFFNINIYRSRPVVVIDGDAKVTVQTASQSPDLIAKAAGFTVYPEDTYDTQTISDPTQFGTVGQQIIIHRSTPVIVDADGHQTVVRTQQTTVGGLLTERDVALGPQDTTSPSGSTPISANLVVHILRVKTVVLSETDAIPFSTQTIKDPDLDAGVTKTITAGVNGEKVSTFRVHYQNGVEQGRELLSSSVTKEPTGAVVSVGTKINYSADPVALGQQMAGARGWTGYEWDALYQLWEHESGWNPNARNFWSGACGIPQANPCSKIYDHSTAGQITWGLDYIAGRYGSPSAAWAYWQRNHSY